MRYPLAFPVAGVLAIVAIVSAAWAPGAAQSNTPWPSADTGSFTALEPIDTHAHAFKADPEFYTFLGKLHLHLVDIVVANSDIKSFPTLEAQHAAAVTFVKDSHGRAVLCTTFDPFRFSKPRFVENAIDGLNRDFAQGAVAVKIWKNIGMELKDPSGHFVMPDDPRLKPIYADIAAKGKTLIAHLAEPDSCWQPPNKNSPDFSYYNEHPQWYMYKQPDHPRKEAILQARDHMLEQNPELRVVGAHLGSLESNLDEMGKRLDRYPNFAVDVAARVAYLTMQPREKSRQFLIHYQDRVLYGTDLSLYDQQRSEDAIKTWEKQYAADWRFFSSAGKLDYRGRTVQGLALPHGVLRKLYHENAVHWIHGVVPGAPTK